MTSLAAVANRTRASKNNLTTGSNGFLSKCTPEERINIELRNLKQLRDDAVTLIHRNSRASATDLTAAAGTEYEYANMSTRLPDFDTSERLALITQAENEKVLERMKQFSLECKFTEFTDELSVNSWLMSIKSALDKDIQEIEAMIKNLKRPKNEDDEFAAEELRGSRLLKSELNAIKSRANAALRNSVMILKPSGHVRKSIRVIYDELMHRIEVLKNSPPDMEAFLGRIAQYKKEQRSKMKHDIIVSNCSKVKTFVPEVRKQIMDEKREEKEKHRHEIYDYKQAKDEEDRQKYEKRILQRDKLSKMSKTARLEEQHRQREIEVRQKWSYLIIIGSRLYAMQQTLQENQKNEENRLKRERAALTIQRAWKRHHQEVENKRHERVMARIRRWAKYYVPKLKERVKTKAADTINNFLTDSNAAARLLNALQQYRTNVVKSQRYVKGFLQVRKAQIKLMNLYWDKVEPTWWERRLRKSNLALNGSNGDVKTSSRTNLAMKKYKANNNAPPFRVPQEIKKRLIAEKIRAISSKFREIYCAQSTKRVKWEADEPTDARSPKLVLPGSSDDSANGHVYINSKTGKPMLLTNSVLISQQELMALMEKGFVEATEKK